MDILVENHQDLVEINIPSVQIVVKSILKINGIHCDDIMIYFVDEPTICDLHSEHFNDPSPTDCISIQVDPIGSIPCFLGEIFISPKAAIDFCKENPNQLYEEITLYLVHGILHLIGYNDLEVDDINKMRLAEKKCMDYLTSNNCVISKSAVL